MARKRNNSDDGGVNLDSLMDALTNVVAVLILVLILVQADVSQKVVQFLEDLIPATPEEVIASTKKVEELDKKKLKIKELLSEDAPKPEQLEEEKRQLALLEKSLKNNEQLLADLTELKKLSEKTKKERDAENKKTTAIQEQIAKLEALLDQTPVLKDKPPTVVNIPTSRPIPNKAKVYHISVINDRVHFIDPFTPLEAFEDEFKKNKRDWIYKRIKQQGADRYIYDPKKILKHFESFDFKNSRNQELKVVGYPTWTRLNIILKLDLKEGGTALEDIAKKDSLFVNILRKLSSDTKSVVFYHIHPNSFNTYLQARAISDKARIAAGWEVKPMGAYTIRVPDVEVHRLEEPPPPDPNAKPKPPGPPRIGPKLD